MELRRRLKKKLKLLMGNQTQEVFARKIGIGQASLNRILKGDQDVGIDMIEQICKFMGTSVEELIGGTVMPESNPIADEGLRESENQIPI